MLVIIGLALCTPLAYLIARSMFRGGQYVKAVAVATHKHQQAKRAR